MEPAFLKPVAPRSFTSTRDRQQRYAERVLLASIPLFALGNVLFASSFSSGSSPVDLWLVLAWVEAGAIFAQLGLHAIWCVLASVRLWKRFAWGAAAGLTWFAAWVMGLLIEDVGGLRQLGGRLYLLRDLLPTVVLCLPLAVLAAQTPLWIVRGFLRWRIVHRHDPARRQHVEPMGIRHLLIATGVVAAAISAGRTGLMLDGASPSSALVELVLGAVAVAGIGSLTMLPALVVTLRAWPMRRVLPMILLFYVGVALMISALRVLERGTVSLQQSVEDCTVLAGLVVCLTVPLLLMRWFGYRLYWGRR